MLKRLILAEPEKISDKIVVSLTTLGAIGAELREHGVKVHALGMTSPLGFPIVLLRLIKLILQNQPDIVQTWMFHADLLGGLAARLVGKRNVIWGIRVAKVPANNKQTILVMKVCAFLSRWVPKKILCVAESAREEHAKYGYNADRMVVINNGFDFSQFIVSPEQRNKLRVSCGFTADDFVVGWFGRFHPDKGQENFVKAARLISNVHDDVKFLLAGSGCEAENSLLMAWLHDYGLQDKFVLLGVRKDVPVCLSAIDLFCMPSSNEGFPNGLGEAMATGLPCVATRAGDAHLLVADTGILVPIENEQALAEGMLKVIEMSAGEREQMGLRAKSRVMNEFSIAKACERYLALYQEVVSSN